MAFFQILDVVDDIVWRNASARLKESSESLTNYFTPILLLLAASFVLPDPSPCREQSVY